MIVGRTNIFSLNVPLTAPSLNSGDILQVDEARAKPEAGQK